MTKGYLPSTVNNAKISTLVEIAAQFISENPQLKLGDELEHNLTDMSFKTKVWGFTRDRVGLILEVIINGVSVNKVVLGKNSGSYRITTNPRFISDYKRLVGLTD